MESLWLNDRALERRNRRSEARFLMRTQNFFFVPRSWQEEKTSFSTITLSGIAAKCILARLRTRVAVQTVLSSFFLSFLFLNAFLGDIKSISSSTVYVLGNKFVLNPPQSHHLPVRVKMTPSWPKTCFVNLTVLLDQTHYLTCKLTVALARAVHA